MTKPIEGLARSPHTDGMMAGLKTEGAAFFATAAKNAGALGLPISDSAHTAPLRHASKNDSCSQSNL